MNPDDYELLDLQRLPHLIVGMIQALSHHERVKVLATYEAEPFTTSIERHPDDEGWMIVRVGKDNPVQIGLLHVAALTLDQGSLN